METILSSRKHHYVAKVCIFLIAVALIAGMVGCGGGGVVEYDLTMAADPAAGGTATGETNGSPYAAGAAVNIKAEANTGYQFVSWTAPAGGFADANAEVTTFTMPAQDVTVTANFAQPQFKTYSKYGFSFEYPRTASVTETGMLESEANDSSGMVEVLVENEKFEGFSVIWTTMMPDEIESVPGGLEGMLEDELESIVAELESSEEIASVEKGELVEATKAGHPIFYQDYTVNSTEGYKMYGVSSFFYCDNSLKLFLLNIVSSEEDCLGDFQNYLDSFVCH